MKFHKVLLLMPVALAAMAAGSIPALADKRGPTSYKYQRSTFIEQKRRTSSQNERNARAMALHDRAVVLAHRATAAAKRGDRRGAARLAARAQVLFNRAFQLTHPQTYAHRRGM